MSTRSDAGRPCGAALDAALGDGVVARPGEGDNLRSPWPGADPDGDRVGQDVHRRQHLPTG
jgi:hypothetical protein